MHKSLWNSLLFPAALCAAGLLTACSDDEGEGGIIFVTRNTSAAFGSTGKVAMSERWFVFQADEFTTGAAGSDLNGDGDAVDSVAVLVDMAAQLETSLGVSVDEMAILGSAGSARVYLIVSEVKDGFDWSGDAALDDVVLLSVAASGATKAGLTRLADVDGASAKTMLVTTDRVWFVEQPAVSNPLLVGESAINFIDLAFPTTPTRVAHAIAVPAGADLIDVLAEPSLIAADSEVVFFTMDENLEAPAGSVTPGVNLNGNAAGTADADTTDGFVLGVINAALPTDLAISLGYAVPSDTTPVRAAATTADDRLIAFLVSEAAQGPTNFNNSLSPDLPASGWLPSQCGTEDTDATDNVLHWVAYQAFVTSPVTARPTNTGLAGKLRALVMVGASDNFVGTISGEIGAGCDLNFDGDAVDDVFRWAPAGPGNPFFIAPAGLLAVEKVPGGVSGVSDLGERFVAVISESENGADFDGDILTDPGFETENLVAWVDPSVGTTAAWTFDHSPSGGNQPAGTDWMTERPQRDRLLVSFQEAPLGLSINTGGDDDKLDSAPSFAHFASTDNLDFPGPPVATDIGNAGIVLANEFGFYRVDEAADNRDWNTDTDKTDFVLFRTTVSNLQGSSFLGVLNDLPIPAVFNSGTIGAAFVSNEAMAGTDFNNDGDMTDLVLRWFRIG
jgi:hypothetical protein